MEFKINRTICYSKNVDEASILQAINNGAKSLKPIQQQTGACTGNRCKELNPSGKCCSGDILKLLNETPEQASGCCCNPN